MKKTVALIYGGEGRERGISMLSAKRIFSFIDKEKYNVIPIYISIDGNWYISGADPFGNLPTAGGSPTYPVRLHGVSGFLSGGKILPVHIALPILHGDFGEDGIIQGALDSAHIGYIGCNTQVSAVCSDKAYTKAIAESLCIKTAKYVVERGVGRDAMLRAKRVAEDKIGYPMFIKPTGLGSSIGARTVKSSSEFEKAYISAARYGSGVLIEELIDTAYEVECACLYDGGKGFFSAGGIIRTDGKAYGFGEKYMSQGGIEVSHSAEYYPGRTHIENASVRLADALGIRHFARIDFLVTHDGEIYFNEINTIPGMTAKSLYPVLTEDMGYSEGEFINLLIDAVIG